MDDGAENGGAATPRGNDADGDQSFVNKFKSHVSDIISITPLSKWFGKTSDSGTVRVREDDANDEELYRLQPPAKRVKLPGNGLNFGPTPRRCQNNFPEPVAGPSGVKSLKLGGPGAQNGKDSDSEESTSGYSSVARIGSKEQVCGSQESSKQTSPLENSPNKTRATFQNATTSTRSLFADRSLSPNMNSSVSSRRPSFNASTFGSPHLIDRTLSTQKIINSPFYSGRTIYGGASAYGKALGRSSRELKANLRKTIEIKPVNRSEGRGNVQLGKTARRILDTLEQYSTPVQDAKKIPIYSKKSRSDGMLTRYTGANPYTVRVPSNKELQVPSVTDLLKMKQNQQKTRLQDSTEAVRQIATLSKSTLNEESYKITTTEKEQDKHTTKMKTKISSVRQKTITEETHCEPKLNPIALPITTLPKFDIKLPEQPKTTTSSAKPKEPPTSKPATPPKRPLIVDPPFKTATSEEFKFSEPKILGENTATVIGINDFKFSEPVCKKSKNEAKANFKVLENHSKTKNNGETSTKTSDASVSLVEKFKPPENSWECPVCMVRNKGELSKCAACETPKKNAEKTTNKPSVGFGDKFKPSASTWECSACLVRNKEESTKCVACETSKPSPKPSAGFGSKFAPPADTWECGTCLVRNKKEKIKCAACETPRKGSSVAQTVAPTSVKAILTGFGGEFAPPPDTWECDTCMVRNGSSADRCAACETPRKRGEESRDGWKCEVCMVKNGHGLRNCQCCEAERPGPKPAGNVPTVDETPPTSFNFGVDTGSSSFTFGVPPAEQKTTYATNAASIFGAGAKTEPPGGAAGGFTFGIPPKADDETTAEAPKVNPLLKPDEKLPERAEKAPDGFTFKVAAPEKKAEVSSSTGAAEVATDPKPASANKPDFTFAPPETDAAKTAKKPAEEPPKPTFKFGANSDTRAANFAPKTGQPTLRYGPRFSGSPNVPAAAFAAEVAPFKSSSNALPPPPALSSAAPTFGAGSNAAAPQIFGGSSNAPALGATFGKSPATTTATFGGGANTAEPPPSFGSSSNVTATFGSGPNAPAAGKTPAFGGSSNVQGFGNAAEVKPFGFGKTAASQQANSDAPPAKAPMFSFGQSPAAAAGGFGAPKTEPGPVFSFGKSAAFGATPKEGANIFDGAAPASVNGGFSFGAQKAGFNFGSSGNSTPRTAFNFGSASAAAPPTGGFSFTAPAQGPVFDANAKPTFNFTGNNIPSFSAPPSDGAAAAQQTQQRKKIRATRRTQR